MSGTIAQNLSILPQGVFDRRARTREASDLEAAPAGQGMEVSQAFWEKNGNIRVGWSGDQNIKEVEMRS
jgi:hypothetical protein